MTHCTPDSLFGPFNPKGLSLFVRIWLWRSWFVVFRPEFPAHAVRPERTATNIAVSYLSTLPVHTIEAFAPNSFGAGIRGYRLPIISLVKVGDVVEVFLLGVIHALAFRGTFFLNDFTYLASQLPVICFVSFPIRFAMLARIRTNHATQIDNTATSTPSTFDNFLGWITQDIR